LQTREMKLELRLVVMDPWMKRELLISYMDRAVEFGSKTNQLVDKSVSSKCYQTDRRTRQR
jgi:hypothetical protein